MPTPSENPLSVRDTVKNLLAGVRMKTVDGLHTYESPDNPGPFFADLDPPPVLTQEEVAAFRPVDEVNLDQVADGTLIHIDGYNEQTEEMEGHPDAVYTLQVKDIGGKRYVRIWRRLPNDLTSKEERKSMTGQGLFVGLKKFTEHVPFHHAIEGKPLIRPRHALLMPYFYEGEGPGKNILPPNAPEDKLGSGRSYMCTPGRVRIKPPFQ